MATYEEIKKANEAIKTTDIKGKDYAEVNQRIKAFRMVYPAGYIDTVMVSNENGICVFRAEVGEYVEGARRLLGSGMAYEHEGSTFINKTSYIENCETSAVGRALGMAGFGIDTSVASFEEVSNAIANQNAAPMKASSSQIETLKAFYRGDNMQKLLDLNGISRIEDISMEKASSLIAKLRGGATK